MDLEGVLELRLRAGAGLSYDNDLMSIRWGMSWEWQMDYEKALRTFYVIAGHVKGVIQEPYMCYNVLCYANVWATYEMLHPRTMQLGNNSVISNRIRDVYRCYEENSYLSTSCYVFLLTESSLH